MAEQVDRNALAEVLRVPGPVCCVYVGPAPDVVNEYRLEWTTRWRPLADQLREDGADEATISALESAVEPIASARAASGNTEVAAFGRAGHVLAVFRVPGATWSDHASMVAPAQVLPLLTWAHERPAYVMVTIDRTGADIEACPGAGGAPVTVSVEGPDDEIERNAPGGFLAQPRYQRRAEDSWKHNAGAVAEQVAAAVERVGAQLLVVSGDVRAVQLLRGRLPQAVHRQVRIEQVKGSRANDGSQGHRAEVLADVRRETVRAEVEELLSSFAEQRAPGGLSVEGETATLAALAEGKVGTLLLEERSMPTVDAWFGAGPHAVLPTTLPRPDWPDVHAGRLVDVAGRTALLTGAQVRVVPDRMEDGLADGLGGLCRFH